MNDNPRKAEVEKILGEWRKKYCVTDSDPLMATLELWQILVENSRAADPAQVFRHELERLVEITKSLSVQTNQLIAELRQVPKIKSELWLFPYFTVLLAIVAALIIGIFVGRFFLFPK